MRLNWMSFILNILEKFISSINVKLQLYIKYSPISSTPKISIFSTSPENLLGGRFASKKNAIHNPFRMKTMKRVKTNALFVSHTLLGCLPLRAHPNKKKSLETLWLLVRPKYTSNT